MPSIPWYTGGPEMLIPAQEKRRRLGALAGLAGLPATFTQRYGAFRTDESKEAAQKAQLEARLGVAEDRAQSQSQPLEATQPSLYQGMLGATPPASSNEAIGGSSDQAAIQEVPADSPGSIAGRDTLGMRSKGNADDEESTLGKFARTGAAVLFGASIPNEGRQATLGRLAGTVAGRQDRTKLLTALGPYLRQSADPGRIVRSQVPWANVPDTPLRAPKEGKGGIWDVIAAAQSPDPAIRARAQSMLQDYAKYGRAQPAGAQPSEQHEESYKYDPLTDSYTRSGKTVRKGKPGDFKGDESPADPGTALGGPPMYATPPGPGAPPRR